MLNGGTLQYTGGAASIDRLFTLGTGGGTIDASGTGALNLNNTGSLGLQRQRPAHAHFDGHRRGRQHARRRARLTMAARLR